MRTAKHNLYGYKIETSMKICDRFSKVWKTGYCDLYPVMYTDEPIYYNHGVYGWNCDLYIDYKHDAIITTGYRNMRGARIPSDVLQKYNKRAERILKDRRYKTYDSRRNALEKNRDEFLEVLNNL